MKGSIKIAGKALMFVLCLTLINCGLLVLAFCLPTSKMRQHVADSYPLIESEKPYLQWDQGYTSSTLDGWSEYTLYGAAINEDAEGNAFEKAMMMWYLDTEGLSRDISTLKYAREPDANFEMANYPRYWNGVVIFMKVLLLFFTIPDIRMLNMFLNIALLSVAIALMIKRNLGKYMIPFVTAILFINPVTMIMSVIFSAEYIPMLLCIIAILRWGDIISKYEGGWELLFAITGSVTAFMCFLSSPVIALGVPLVVLIWINEEKNVVKTVVTQSLYWVGAYAVTWVLKWIICTLFTSHNLIANAINQMVYYEGTQAEDATIIERLMKNLWSYKTPAFMTLFAMAVVLIIIYQLVNGKSIASANDHIEGKKAFWDVIIGYILIICIPFAMFIILGNGYAYVHHFMAHRQLAIAGLGALCIARYLCEKGILLYYKKGR